MKQKTLPRLLVPKEEAARKIQERIEKGKQLHDLRIDSEDRLEIVGKEANNWSRYNIDLLIRLFDNSSLEDEYEGFHYSKLTYAEMDGISAMGWPIPNLNDLVVEYKSDMVNSIKSLEGIRDRLELFDESSVNHSFAFGDEVFIVHGRDDGPKETVAGFLRKLGLKATILHEQPSEGLTIIEKLEKYANNAGFAIVLFTPDDVGALKNEIEDQGKPRARQNVVFELGYFIGKLGRKRVCPLFKGEIEKPSDIDGVIYVPMNGEDWKLKLCQEMKNADFPIDMNDIL